MVWRPGRENGKRLQGPTGKALSDIHVPGEQEFVGTCSVSVSCLSGGWCTGVRVSESVVQVGSQGSEIRLSVSEVDRGHQRGRKWASL